jgi:hypothetical protein
VSTVTAVPVNPISIPDEGIIFLLHIHPYKALEPMQPPVQSGQGVKVLSLLTIMSRLGIDGAISPSLQSCS